MIVDISYYNTVKDWIALRNAVDGVIIRLGYTGYGSGKIMYDKQYHDNIKAAELMDIKRGVYFFPQSVTEKEAEAEADFIAQAVGGKVLELGVWLDSEIADVKNKSGRADKLTRAIRTGLLHIIIERLKYYGIAAGVYASKSWLENQLDMSRLKNVPVWVAQYNKECTYRGSYIMWQYTSKGKVPGIVGNVDLSEIVYSVSDEDPELDNAVEVIARRVIKGDFGQGHEMRRNSIYELIRKKVNDII